MFRKDRSLGIRVWHWLDAAVIFGLLSTVLLRNTIVSPRANAALMAKKLEGAGVTVSVEQARGAAAVVNQRLWAWHVNFGYALAALAVLRVVVLLLDKQKAATSPGAASLHYRVVKGLHRSFYVALGVMVATGLALVFKEALGLGKPVMARVHWVHENVMWYVIVFVAVHVAGVVRAEQREDAGIVSEMIHGGREGRGGQAASGT